MLLDKPGHLTSVKLRSLSVLFLFHKGGIHVNIAQVDNLPDIDGKETKKEVEKIISEFRNYLMHTSLGQMPNVTAKYTLVPPTGGFDGSSTETAAVNNVDYEINRKKLMDKIIRAVNRLSYKERSIITMKFFGEEELFDYEVYTELCLSHRTYYRIKSSAFYKLALALKIVVYKEGEHS